jgi:hypothetical protein
LSTAEPTQPPDDRQQSAPVDSPPPDEDSALLPAILAAYAAYLAWRGAHSAPPTGWRQISLAIGLRGLIGDQLGMVAARAFRWQQSVSGRSGDDLWNTVNEAVKAGIEAGIQTIAEALIWTETHATDVPSTRDIGTSGEATAPTRSNPPTLLAQMAAQAVVNATIHAAAAAAGWTGKMWRSQEDSRVRDTHRALDRTSVPMDEPFVSPSGAKLRFPGDPRAPIDEVANCRCFLKLSRR